MTESVKSKSVEIEPIKYNGSVSDFRAWMDGFLSHASVVMLQPSTSQDEIKKRAFDEQKDSDIIDFSRYYPRLIVSYSEIDQSSSREVWYVTKYDPIADNQSKPLKKWATILAVETLGKTTVEFLDGIYFRLRESNGRVTDYARANFIGDDFSSYVRFIKDEWGKNYSHTELNTQEQAEVKSEPKVEKTVFISYRRKDISWALAIYQYLTKHDYDVFFDFTSIPSGDFEQIIISNIKARAHFLVILTPSALDRCNEPDDWLRCEIEAAISEKRNIIPLFIDGFSFGTPAISRNLTGKLETLKKYNGLDAPANYFDAAMDKLRNMFLNVAPDAVLHPVPVEVQKVIEEQKIAANEAILQQEEGLSKSLESDIVLQKRKPTKYSLKIKKAERISSGFPIRFRNDTDEELFEKFKNQSIEKKRLLKLWNQLLDKNSSKEEIHKFIEKYPVLLPDLYNLHHGPMYSIVASNFLLSSKYMTDFAYLSSNSAIICFNFLKLVDSDKFVFNSDFSLASDFDHSLSEVQDWKKYANDNKDELKSKFIDLLGTGDLKDLVLAVQCFLIFGRRKNIESHQRSKERWGTLVSSNSDAHIEIMSYDRLTDSIESIPSQKIYNRQVVCSYEDGFYWIPETFETLDTIQTQDTSHILHTNRIPAIQEFMIRSGDFFGRPKRIRQASATEIEKISNKLQLNEILEFANSKNAGERVACGIALREKIKSASSLCENF